MNSKALTCNGRIITYTNPDPLGQEKLDADLNNGDAFKDCPIIALERNDAEALLSLVKSLNTYDIQSSDQALAIMHLEDALKGVIYSMYDGDVSNEDKQISSCYSNKSKGSPNKFRVSQDHYRRD